MAFFKQLPVTPRRASRVLIPLVAVAIAAAAAGSATAAVKASKTATMTTGVSSNWSGYVVGGTDPTTGEPISFSSVSGTWVQPTADCTSATGGATASAFWVGLGGNTEGTNALEQTGTEADCNAAGVAHYSAWYELVPSPSVKLSLKINAGDTISASVTVTGTKVAIQLQDVTTGATFAKTLTKAAPDTASAEWIAEAPSICASSYQCQTTDLTDFGAVKFSNATATSNGHTGTISDPAWTATKIQLVAGSDGGGFGYGYGRFASQATPSEALPTALTGKGAVFSIKWHSGASLVVPSGSGYGGSGYGGSGYGGSGGYGYGY